MRLSTILSPFLFAGIVVSAAVRNLPRGLAASAEEFSSQVYHHIVIGGGTTGLAVAARWASELLEMTEVHWRTSHSDSQKIQMC